MTACAALVGESSEGCHRSSMAAGVADQPVSKAV